MFDRVLSTFNRKRVASEAVSTQQLADKTNLQKYVETKVDVVPIEKKMKMTPSQKVCLKCLAGESGHITHVLSNIEA